MQTPQDGKKGKQFLLSAHSSDPFPAVAQEEAVCCRQLRKLMLFSHDLLTPAGFRVHRRHRQVCEES